MPVLPATWDAEARGSLEPMRSRLQGAMIVPLYSSLGNRVRLQQTKAQDTRYIREPYLGVKFPVFLHMTLKPS